MNLIHRKSDIDSIVDRHCKQRTVTGSFNYRIDVSVLNKLLLNV